jgi:hypothetical protein
MTKEAVIAAGHYGKTLFHSSRKMLLRVL